MFNILSKLVYTTNIESTWLKWIEWQKNQSNNHFHDYNHNLNFFYNENYYLKSICSNIKENDKIIYYSYCFGDFLPLLILSERGLNKFEYIRILVELYDFCKGIGRILSGDSEIIIEMRESLETECTINLDKLKVENYLYPYGTIHAHTVAYFSISTLLYRIYLHHSDYNDKNKFKITPCKNAYDEAIFGSYKKIKTLVEIKKTNPKCLNCFSEIEDVNHNECYKCRGFHDRVVSGVSEVLSCDSYLLRNKIFYDH